MASSRRVSVAAIPSAALTGQVMSDVTTTTTTTKPAEVVAVESTDIKVNGNHLATSSSSLSSPSSSSSSDAGDEATSSVEAGKDLLIDQLTASSLSWEYSTSARCIWFPFSGRPLLIDQIKSLSFSFYTSTSTTITTTFTGPAVDAIDSLLPSFLDSFIYLFPFYFCLSVVLFFSSIARWLHDYCISRARSVYLSRQTLSTLVMNPAPISFKGSKWSNRPGKCGTITIAYPLLLFIYRPIFQRRNGNLFISLFFCCFICYFDPTTFFLGYYFLAVSYGAGLLHTGRPLLQSTVNAAANATSGLFWRARVNLNI